MPDLFVSPSGSNSASGADFANALRTITFAIEQAGGFGTALVTIHLAPGTYDRAGGETFPLEMAQNISVIGAGVGASIIRYERPVSSRDDLAISGGGELADFTLQGLPLGTRACYSSTGIRQSIAATHIHDLVIELAPGAAAGEVAFGSGLVIDNDALVERVTVQDCEYAISLQSPGFQVRDCTVRNARRYGVTAYAGGGEVRDCNFVGNHWALNLWAANVQAVDNRFDGNISCIHVGGDQSTPSVIRRNDMRGGFEGVVLLSDARVINNDFLTTNQQIAILVGTGTPPGLANSNPAPITPEIRNNRVRRTGPTNTLLVQPLVGIGGGSRPVFESNAFMTDDNLFAFMTVHAEAVPNLGSPPAGSSPQPPGRRSEGRNNFQAGWIHFFQDDSASNKRVYAYSNYWRNVPVRQGSGWRTPHEWYVDPSTRRSSVTLDSTGAMRA